MYGVGILLVVNDEQSIVPVCLVDDRHRSDDAGIVHLDKFFL